MPLDCLFLCIVNCYHRTLSSTGTVVVFLFKMKRFLCIRWIRRIEQNHPCINMIELQSHPKHRKQFGVVVKVPDSWASNMVSIPAQFSTLFKIFFCWIRLIRWELWKKLECLAKNIFLYVPFVPFAWRKKHVSKFNFRCTVTVVVRITKCD